MQQHLPIYRVPVLFPVVCNSGVSTIVVGEQDPGTVIEIAGIFVWSADDVFAPSGNVIIGSGSNVEIYAISTGISPTSSSRVVPGPIILPHVFQVVFHSNSGTFKVTASGWQYPDPSSQPLI